MGKKIKKVKFEWSKDRPARPDRDPILEDLVGHLRRDKRSYFAKANVSGVSITAIKNIEEGTTRRPQGVTLWMIYKGLGYPFRAPF